MSAYGSEYGQDGRQQPQQNFGGYNTAAMMYNVAQPSAQTPVYDAQQFGSRQPAAMPMMAPDVASTYFNTDATNPSSSNLQHSAGSSTGVYQQTSNYTNSMSGVGTVQQTTGSADVSMNEDPEYSDGALEEKWLSYQRQLGTVFQDITIG